MRLLLAIACVVAAAFVASSASAQPAYSWTVSASSTDPRVNTATIPGFGNLYLWLECSNLADPDVEGVAAAEFGLMATNGLQIVAVEFLGSFLVIGSPLETLIAFGCPTGPVAAARLVVIGATAGSICFGPSPNGIQHVIDCRPEPQGHPFNWTGCSVNGGDACEQGFRCTFAPISVESRAWGEIKALYH